MVFRRIVKNRKHLNCIRENRNIVDYGRCISTNKIFSKASNMSGSNWFDKSKLSQRNDSEYNMADRNSNCTERIKLKSDSVLTKATRQSKTIKNYFNTDKSCSLAESDKFVRTYRRRYKSTDNEELRKIVNTKTNESPSQIQSTVNKWLKETLPSITIDSDNFKSTSCLSGYPKTNSQSQSNTSINNDYLQKEMMKRFEKIEKCCEDLLTNSRSPNSKSYVKDVNFYQLLGNLHKSLKELNTRRRNNFSEIKNDSHFNNPINSSLENPSYNTLLKENNPSSHGLDEIVHLTSIPYYPSSMKSNLSRNANFPEVNDKSIENEISKLEKFGKLNLKNPSNHSNLLISEFLKNPKLSIKSKCIAGIHENFLEEQYIVSAFKFISNKERETFLKEEIRKRSKAIRDARLSGAEMSSLTNLTKIYIDKKIQTTNTILKERMPSNFTKNKQNIFSQTSYGGHSPFLPKSDIKKVVRYRDDILNMTDNENKVSRLTYREFEENFNYDVREVTSAANFTDTYMSNCDQSIISKSCITNLDPFFKASVEFYNIDVYIIHETIPEISSWHVYSSKVGNIYNFAIDPGDKNNLLIDSLFKCNLNIQIQSPPESIVYSSVNHSRNNTNDAEISVLHDPFLQLKDSTSDKPKDKNDAIQVSLIEQSCQKIKSSLDKNVNIPENLNNFLERLLKLQKILESIPKDKMSLMSETMDETDSTESTYSNFRENLRFDQYIEKDQHPTSLGDVTIAVDGKESPTNQFKKNKVVRTATSLNDLKSMRLGDTDRSCNDDQSEVTTSLSLLENLIGDFLTQNKLSNTSKH